MSHRAQHLLSPALLVWMGLASAAASAAAPAEDPAPAPRALEIRSVAGTGRAAGAGYRELEFTVRNPNPVPVYYSGYPLDVPAGSPRHRIAPRYRLELRRGKDWAAYNLGWCGTGKRIIPIAGGQTQSFVAAVPPGDWEAVRAGLTWFPAPDAFGSPHTDWSPPVTRAQSEPGARSAP